MRFQFSSRKTKRDRNQDDADRIVLDEGTYQAGRNIVQHLRQWISRDFWRIARGKRCMTPGLYQVRDSQPDQNRDKSIQGEQEAHLSGKLSAGIRDDQRTHDRQKNQRWSDSAKQPQDEF